MSRRADRRASARATLMTAAWFARMRSDIRTADDERRFGVWLDGAPERRNAYTGMRHSFERVEALSDHPKMLARRAAALRRRPLALRLLAPTSVRAAVLALAAAVTLIVTLPGLPGAILDFQRPNPPGVLVFQTGAGNQRTFPLDDGTLVTLASGSSIKVLYCDALRRVKLERGEAYFDVMQDAQRPFIVQAGSGAITAIGTEFNVYKANGDVTVTLVEGLVQVDRKGKTTEEKETVRLDAGQQVSFDADSVSAVRAVDTDRVTSWKNRRLQLAREPFISVVDEFNRHSKYRLYLNRHDSRLQNVEISGTATLDHPESLVEQLRGPLRKKGIEIQAIEDSRGNLRLRLHSRRAGN